MSANPIQIVPLHTQTLAAAGTPRLMYRGGPVLTSVQVSTLFWGEAWSLDPQAALVPELNAFFDFILGDALIDQVAEYGVPGSAIGHGSRVATARVAGAPNTDIADADIQRVVQAQIASKSMPAPTPNGLYFVYLPPSVTVGMDGGSSCVNFCGYHSDVSGVIFYAVMPYPDCGGCTKNMSVLDALTSTSSHELCEAVTDPIPGQGWYDDKNGEIGDICAWQTKRIGAYTVQLEWSNRAAGCI